MPADISSLAPSMDAESFDYGTKAPSAFTILQKDGLESSLPLLQVNEEDEINMSQLINQENMKNDLYSSRRISRSNDHLILANLQSSQVNPLRKKHQSKSHDNLNTVERPNIAKSSITLSTENFHEILNAKLKKLQEQNNAEQNGKPSKRFTLSSIHKKPFITTVKTGEFLMPPPEVAALLGLSLGKSNEDMIDGCPLRSRFKPPISFAKRPEVRHSSHNARCPAALKATVDFSLGMVNATTIAASRAMDERARQFKRQESTGFSQTPRALPKKLEPIEGRMNVLPKLRGDEPVPFRNLMFDRRVIRGSTCASVPSLIDDEPSIAARQAEVRRRYLARKRAQINASKTLVRRKGSPPPVPGRKHEPVQTELFLEELAEKPDEFEVATQTDYFLDKPITPRYYRSKIGKDASTQIEPGELFDFDTEVQPILEVLVGKTIEQALMEVIEDEEIAIIKHQQRMFLEVRAGEKAELERLVEEERRIREEKSQRKKQEAEDTRIQQENEERVAAAVLLTGYVAELLPSVLEGLKMSGYLMDEIKTDVEEGFMPWLMKEVKKEMGNMVESRELLMEIIREILENRAQTYKQLGEQYDASREKIIITEEDLKEDNSDRNFINYETPAFANDNAI